MKKSIHREIFGLAIPNIVSNISVPLIGSVDTILMGQISSTHLGAIGLGGMIFNFLYWNMAFLRMSTTGSVAQAYGAGDGKEQWHALVRTLAVALGIALLLIMTRSLLTQGGILAFQVASDQQELVREYFMIRIWASPAALSLMVFLGWFFGMQNAWYPLWITVVINVGNILLSVILVQQYEMGIKGVALGTVIAQYIGLGAAVVLFGWKYLGTLKSSIRGAFAQMEDYARFFRVNADIFVRTMMLSLVFGFMYRVSSGLGLTLLAINTVIFQFLNWMSYGIDGFAYAAESLVGKYKGAKDQVGLDSAVGWSFGWAGLMALLISLGYAVFYIPLFGIFSDDPAILEEALRFRYWVAAMPLLGFASYIWDGVFVGLLASKAMRRTMTLSAVLFFGVFFGFKSSIPEVIPWVALMTFLLARAISQYILYRKDGLYRV